MVKIVPGAMRSTISEDFDGLRIVIPIKRNFFLLAFLSVWLCGWGVGESTAAYQVLAGKIPPSGQAFILFWLCGWTLGGGFAIYAWLNLATGREVVRITRNELILRGEVLSMGRSREYDLASVADLRASAMPFNPMDFKSGMQFWGMAGGAIAFDYGAKTYRFGRGLEEAEARQLVEVINKWRAQQPNQPVTQ